jgi:putative tryptophan/tyrosine transport system substrate-binding protein
MGWGEGRNLRIDFRGAGNNAERMQAFAKELLALQPNVVLTRSTPATAAFLEQTRTIPMFSQSFPIPLGITSSKAWHAQGVMLPGSPTSSPH